MKKIIFLFIFLSSVIFATCQDFSKIRKPIMLVYGGDTLYITVDSITLGYNRMINSGNFIIDFTSRYDDLDTFRMNFGTQSGIESIKHGHAIFFTTDSTYWRFGSTGTNVSWNGNVVKIKGDTVATKNYARSVSGSGGDVSVYGSPEENLLTVWHNATTIKNVENAGDTVTLFKPGMQMWSYSGDLYIGYSDGYRYIFRSDNPLFELQDVSANDMDFTIKKSLLVDTIHGYGNLNNLKLGSTSFINFLEQEGNQVDIFYNATGGSGGFHYFYGDGVKFDLPLYLTNYTLTDTFALIIYPNNKVDTIGLVSAASYGLTMSFISATNQLKDILNGEMAWYYPDSAGNIVKYYVMPKNPAKINAMQNAQIEMNVRRIAKLEKQNRNIFAFCLIMIFVFGTLYFIKRK